VGEPDVMPVQMLLAVCGRHMSQAHGFDNWRAPYPLERLRADARERAVYAVEEQGTMVATFTLGDRPVHPYDEAIWQRPGEPAVYVNRLAVLPAEQGRGLGRWCMRWIMGKAAKAGRLAVRLDVLEANTRLREFYRALGFAERGRREHSGYAFVCMERLIVPRRAVDEAEGDS
jgi:ribosomal protein S18 acetylase RimI-like enzyme